MQMNFVATTLLLFTILMVAFASSLNAWKLPKMKSRLRKLFSSKNAKTGRSLRTRNLSEELGADKVDGFFETVELTDDDATTSMRKTIAVDVCSLSADPTHEGEYVQAAVYSFSDFVFYEINTKFFNDSSCTNLQSEETFSLPVLSYEDALDEVILEPSKPVEDGEGFSFLLYNSQKNCVKNDYQVGVTEAVYSKFGDCMAADDPSNGGFDTKFISCSSSQLVANTYSSTDGSCTGTITPQILVSSDFCQSGEETILDNYYGYLTFGCAALPSYL